MTEPLSDREVSMLESVRKVPVPATVREFAKATERSLSANLLRASVADRLLDRVRENARFALRVYIELLSIKYTQQRWSEGIEYSLWRAVLGPRSKMTDQEADRLRQLANEAGGWYAVPQDTDEPQFVGLDDWRARYTDWAELPPESDAR